MHRTLTLMAVFLIAGTPPYATGKPWRTFEDCQLIEDDLNDGGTVRVKVKVSIDPPHHQWADTDNLFVSLYNVQVASSKDEKRELIEEQAAYWKTSEARVLSAGKSAKTFIAECLADGFTIHIKEDSFHDPYFLQAWRLRLQDPQVKESRPVPLWKAIVMVGDQDLAEALVCEGLARSLGWIGAFHNQDLPDGSKGRVYATRLTKAESIARNNKRGVWGRRVTWMDPSQADLQAAAVAGDNAEQVTDQMAGASGESGAVDGLRNWTTRSGETLLARMVSFENERVKLQGTNARTYVIHVDRLVEADKWYVILRQQEPVPVAAGDWAEPSMKKLSAARIKIVERIISSSLRRRWKADRVLGKKLAKTKEEKSWEKTFRGRVSSEIVVGMGRTVSGEWIVGPFQPLGDFEVVLGRSSLMFVSDAAFRLEKAVGGLPPVGTVITLTENGEWLYSLPPE